jgi:hypothetical protein
VSDFEKLSALLAVPALRLQRRCALLLFTLRRVVQEDLGMPFISTSATTVKLNDMLQAIYVAGGRSRMDNYFLAPLLGVVSVEQHSQLIQSTVPASSEPFVDALMTLRMLCESNSHSVSENGTIALTLFERAALTVCSVRMSYEETFQLLGTVGSLPTDMPLLDFERLCSRVLSFRDHSVEDTIESQSVAISVSASREAPFCMIDAGFLPAILKALTPTRGLPSAVADASRLLEHCREFAVQSVSASAADNNVPPKKGSQMSALQRFAGARWQQHFRKKLAATSTHLRRMRQPLHARALQLLVSHNDMRENVLPNGDTLNLEAPRSDTRVNGRDINGPCQYRVNAHIVDNSRCEPILHRTAYDGWASEARGGDSTPVTVLVIGQKKLKVRFSFPQSS